MSWQKNKEIPRGQNCQQSTNPRSPNIGIPKGLILTDHKPDLREHYKKPR